MEKKKRLKKENTEEEDVEYDDSLHSRIEEVYDRDLLEMEKYMEKQGIIPKEFIWFLRYMHLRDRAFLRNLFEYQRLVRSEEMVSVFELAKTIAQTMTPPKPSIKEQWSEIKEVLREVLGSLLPMYQTPMSSPAITQATKIPSNVKVEIEEKD